MAKRQQPAVSVRQHAVSPGEGATTTPADGETGGEHLVVASVASETVGFRLRDIVEIIRLPRLAHMPLGPRSLLGLANLRGSVLPIVSLRRLLALPDAALDEGVRVIVVDRGSPVGFAVDRIQSLDTVAAAGIETDRAGAGRLNPDLLDGVVKGKEGEESIKLLNPDGLLRDEFSNRDRASARGLSTSVVLGSEVRTTQAETQKVSLVSFDLGKQEYALPLDRVREIITAPDQVSEVAGAETAVLGVITLRNRLLPLVSLRALLGLPVKEDREERSKVVVLSMGNATVGMVADRTREILRIDPDLIDPAPPLLTRGEGDAEITSICRLEGGQRIVAVLSPDRLFRSDLVSRVLSSEGADTGNADQLTDDAMNEEQFIVFRLGEQEYGLPIAAIDEVARPPEHITSMPKAPKFIDGIMNLRGRVVPIIDLRRRFELPAQEQSAARRILVVSVGGAQTGFMVDAVSEVLKVQSGTICPSPEISTEQMRLISRVVNLEGQGRMVLLLDPAQLLDKVEADVLAKFDRTKSSQALNAS